MQYVFKVPQGEAEVMLSLMQEDACSALSSVGGKNFAIGFYIMKVSIVDAYVRYFFGARMKFSSRFALCSTLHICMHMCTLIHVYGHTPQAHTHTHTHTTGRGEQGVSSPHCPGEGGDHNLHQPMLSLRPLHSHTRNLRSRPLDL